MTTSIRFNSERERKAYQDGLAIVKAKLVGNRRMTPEGRHQYSMAVGLATVATIKKMSALLKDGLPATQTATAKPIASTASTRKSYSTARTLHRYCNRAWLPTLA